VISGTGTEQISKNGVLTDGQTPQGQLNNAEPTARSDTSDIDRCEKLAKEALRIGQLLGIKVIRNERAAIDNIIESMGTKKGVQTRSSTKALKNQMINQDN